MKDKGKRLFFSGSILIAAFIIWTLLVLWIDVKPLGANETDIGFATINCWFHGLTGVHVELYTLTDWLGLVPITVCSFFGVVGLVQLFKRRNLLKVDYDIIVLGIYYVIVILDYLVFEMIPINYRPILIEGVLEASYPSSTTLLVLCVMPTLCEQAGRRLKSVTVKRFLKVFSICFSVFMVVGRMISGVHWLTDIVGSTILSAGLFYIYKAVILLSYKEDN